MYDIRLAHLFDVKDIVDLQESHREEVKAFPLLTFDRLRCLESMSQIVMDEMQIVIVAEGEVGLAGYMWLAPANPHYSQEYYYMEQYTYVVPEYRGTRVLHKLIEGAKDIAKLKLASYVQLGSFSGNERLTKAYNKRYEKVGEAFLINLKE